MLQRLVMIERKVKIPCVRIYVSSCPPVHAYVEYGTLTSTQHRKKKHRMAQKKKLYEKISAFCVKTGED